MRANKHTQEHTTALTYVNLKAGISMEVCMYDKVGRPVHVIIRVVSVPSVQLVARA